jgi:hypothetical protein
LPRHLEGVHGQLGAEMVVHGQPTTRREQPSRTVAKYSQPCPVGM